MKGFMLGLSLGGLLTAATTQECQFEARPTDDIWVYENAFGASATTGPLLRSWGDGTHSVDPDGQYPPNFFFSYSYLKWNLSGIRPNVVYQVLEARLTVIQSAPPGYSQSQGESYPLEARALEPDFSEANWNFTNPNNPNPGDPIFGIGSMANYRSDTAFPIEINLLGSDNQFGTSFHSAIEDGELALALTSAMNPGDQGGTTFYRFYSKDDPGGRGPVLCIRFVVAGDTNDDGCVNNSDLHNVLTDFGGAPQSGNTDLNSNGIVEDQDLAVGLRLFGNGC